MIAPDADFAGAPLLRREYELDSAHGDVIDAVLHVSAFGVFTARVNGALVSDEVLGPGWSSYQWRLRYRTYDVTNIIRATGDHRLVLGLELGNGWYRGRLGWSSAQQVYGRELAGLLQLDVTFSDGFRQRCGTDTSWTAGPSAVVANDLYNGQTIDARCIDNTWLTAGFGGAGWVGVHNVPFDHACLASYEGPPIRRQQDVAAVRVWTSPAGRQIVDFGQNLVGWVRFSVRGEPGATITVRHAEVLEDGELSTRPLRSAEATDRLILSGRDDHFEPTLTFHGFRYIDVEGWPGELSPSSIVAVVVHSDLRRTGTFECSDELLNQLHRNVVWGLRGNFLDVPTDCPQRDERLGWTGDIAVFAPTATFLYDVDGFLRDWLADLAAEQRAAGGRVPWVVPDVLAHTWLPSYFLTPETTAIWGDAAVWVPWALWEAYGNPAVLSESFGSMSAHIDHVQTLLSDTGLWDRGFQFGDWLDPTAPPDRPDLAKTDPGVVATASLYRTASIAADAAQILGRDEDGQRFTALAARTRAAFNRHYVRADGSIHSDTQTGYTLAIVFGLLDEENRTAAGNRLAELVTDSGHRIATGFAGTAYVLDALSTTGHLDDAFQLLLQRECPSWLYPVTMGATTIWERWDSILPDGSVNPGEMTSFNHYALGAVADWMHRTIGGVQIVEPGYRRVRIAPRPGGGITSATTSLDTRLGTLHVSWTMTAAGELAVDLRLPGGMVADIDVPGVSQHRLTAGHHQLTGFMPAVLS